MSPEELLGLLTQIASAQDEYTSAWVGNLYPSEAPYLASAGFVSFVGPEHVGLTRLGQAVYEGLRGKS